MASLLDDVLPPQDQQEGSEDLWSGEKPGTFAAVVTATDWTTQTILSQLHKGNIELNPNFQRRDAWKALRKSQFIESLILGIPVPQLVLAERKEKRGAYIVIDGKQRLLSLSQFTAKRDSNFRSFRLTVLEIRKDLNGKSFQDLENDIELDEALTNFENQTIRTVVIRNWDTEDFLYTVFLRLNTGSVQLSPQELRQALHPGPFSSFVDEYSIESNLLKIVLKLTEPDFRMRDAELVIRYFAFRNFIHTYTGNLKPLLDYTTEQRNRELVQSREKVEIQIKDFEAALNTAIEIFGPEHAFRKWNGGVYERPLNRAVFDALALSFSDREVSSQAVKQKAGVEVLFKKLCEADADFRASVEGTTKSIESIVVRVGRWGQELANLLGTPVVGADVEGGRIRLKPFNPR